MFYKVRIIFHSHYWLVLWMLTLAIIMKLQMFFFAIRINKYIILHDNVVLSVVITVVQSSTKRRFKWPLPLPQIPLPPLPVLPWQHTTTRCVAGSKLYETDVWPRGGAGVRLHGASGSQTYLAHRGLCEWFPYPDHLI